MNVREVPNQRIELALERQHFGFVKLQARQTGNVADFVQSNGHDFRIAHRRILRGTALQSNVRQPSYPVVTLVTCFLVVVGFGVKKLRPYVEHVIHGPFEGSHEEFLIQGDIESFKWFPNSDKPFLLGRGSGKPILLVIGAPWSLLGRKIDGDAFEDDLVSSLLAEDFVCVRVDGMHHPDWLNALMPIQRLTKHLTTGCQLWILDPQGRAVDLIGQADANQQFDHVSLVGLLEKAEERYSDLAFKAEGQGMPEFQLQDAALIRNTSTFSPPDYAGFDQYLRDAINPTYGGFPIGELQAMYPTAWQFQLELGDYNGLTRSIMPILQSPLHDAIDGGFYRASSSVDCRNIEFDKLTTRNAEMLQLLAEIGQLLPDANCTETAKHVWNYLAQDAYRGDSFATCRVGDEIADGRSEHSSFSPARLRTLLSSEDRAWARAHLGLVVATNPLMTPFPVSLADFTRDSQTLERITRILESATGPPEKFAGLGLLATEGYTAARMVQTARIWRDPVRLNLALDRVDSLSQFEYEYSFVVPNLYSVTDQPVLPDYLAYADAEIEEYFATGRVVSFEKGLARLQRAFDTFSTSDSGSYRMGPAIGSPRDVPGIDVPEIADNTDESCTAQIIRLCFEYGRLLGNTDRGRKLQKAAFEAVDRFTGVTGNAYGFHDDGSFKSVGKSFSATAGGYYAEAMLAQDDRYAIAVGPKAQSLADELFAKVPTRIVAPAFGSVRPDLQKRPPGVYLLSGTSVAGPFTVAEAAERLPATYALNPTPLNTTRPSVP